MDNLEINIQEFAFLMGWLQPKASEFFKQVCFNQHKKYSPKMRLPIQQLVSHRSEVKTLLEKAKDINQYYFKRYESKFKLLNDKSCIEKQKWVGKNAAVKVFLKSEDIQTIESNWRQKKADFYSQQGLFGVVPVLVAPRKTRSKNTDRRVANPN